MLLDHLPRESSTVRSVVGDKARWGESEHLLADVIDALNAQIWQFSSVHSKGKPKRPKPVRRPGREQADGRRFGTARMTLDQARKYLDRFRPQKG